MTTQVAASAADVVAGRATAEGKTISKTRRIEPVAVYFEEGVVRVDPNDLNSAKTGQGLFRTEVYLLALFGCDVAGFSAAQLLTTRYMVDFLLPVGATRPSEVASCTAFKDPSRVTCPNGCREMVMASFGLSRGVFPRWALISDGLVTWRNAAGATPGK